MSRCFLNEFRSSEPPEIDRKYYKNKILECVDKIFKNLQPTLRNGEKGLYTGTAGVAYCLYYLVEANLFPDRNEAFLRAAQSYIDVALHKDNTRSRKKVGLLSGNSGVFLVAALLSSKRNDDEACRLYLREYRRISKVCEDVDFSHGGSDEMFVGRSGYIFGILMLQRELSTEVVSKDVLHGICHAVVKSGVKLRKRSELPGDLPLLYEYHGKAYLGAAHGFAGILQSLLSVPSFLEEEENSRNLIRRSVDYLLDLCKDDNNVASNLDAALSGSGKLLVHWCHGAAGIVYTFARAYLVFDRDQKYLNACRLLAETVWQRGLLKKGPGICHGVAGNGYVFLLLYRLTGEEKYLYRAERFASFMFTQVFHDEARTPDRPYSLYEGWAGTVCFLTDLLRPDDAEYPFMNVFLPDTVTVTSPTDSVSTASTMSRS